MYRLVEVSSLNLSILALNESDMPRDEVEQICTCNTSRANLAQNFAAKRQDFGHLHRQYPVSCEFAINV